MIRLDDYLVLMMTKLKQSKIKKVVDQVIHVYQAKESGFMITIDIFANI